MTKGICSYHQERLWFIDAFERGTLYPEGPVYHNLALVLAFDRAPDPPRLRTCLAGLVARHAALRTVVVTENNVPWQVVREENDPAFTTTDAPEITGPAAVMAACLERIKRPFVLEERLFRAEGLCAGDGRYYLLLVAHHLVADRYTMRLLAAGLLEGYQARAAGPAPAPAGTGISYGQYAAWQKRFSEEAVAELVLHWRSRLKNIQPLELPLDRPRALIHLYDNGLVARQLPPPLTGALRAFAEAYGYTPETVLLAAFKILLSKYSGQESIVVGTVAENRDRPELRGTAGPVANLLPLHSRIKPGDDFRQVLALVQDNYAHALLGKDLPFDKLVAELKPEKDMARTALFDVLFAYERESGLDQTLAGAGATLVETLYGLGKYDLNVLLKETGGELEMLITYNSRYFDENTVAGMAAHYAELLANLLAAPGAEIGKADLLPAAEKSVLLAGLDHTAATWDEHRTLVDVFEEQARTRPGHVAVVCHDLTLTYGELDALANRFARFLLAQHPIGPQDLVALKLEKNHWPIVAMLAVLKCGAAYVPVDPAYPQSRIDFVLADSGSVLCVDDGLVAAFQEPGHSFGSEPLGTAIDPAHLAYVIYTSGSTGTPKGVLIEHRNVTRLFKTSPARFDFTDGDVWTFFHSPSFDFSVWEIYGALLFGGRVVVVAPEVTRDPVLFKQLLQTQGVTVLNLTPTAFYALQHVVEPTDGFRLRYVIFGGENLLPAKLTKWNALFPGVQLVNMYGITETTVHTTYKAITPADIAAGISNIGKPIPTVSCCVLNEHRQVVPAGVPGELYVGGAGVARGYLNRPDLDASRFVDHPHGPGRLYRSGDKVRLLAGGELEYLGRFDDQVKVRGFRIELAEIERQLLRHPLLEEALVLVRTEAGGPGQSLVAFVQARGEVTLPELRDHLRQALPDHMVPDRFVRVDAIPVNENGKADRKALLARGGHDLPGEAAYQAPRNATEERIAEIWQQVLGKPAVGVHDDFFLLGGHSIRAMEVLMHIQNEYQVALPVKTLFTTPTVEALAREVEHTRWAQSGGQPAPDVPVESITI